MFINIVTGAITIAGAIYFFSLTQPDVSQDKCASAAKMHSFDLSRAVEDANNIYECVGAHFLTISVPGSEYPKVFNDEVDAACVIAGSDLFLIVYDMDSERHKRKYGSLEDLTNYAKAFNGQVMKIRESKYGKMCQK